MSASPGGTAEIHSVLSHAPELDRFHLRKYFRIEFIFMSVWSGLVGIGSCRRVEAVLFDFLAPFDTKLNRSGATGAERARVEAEKWGQKYPQKEGLETIQGVFSYPVDAGKWGAVGKWSR